MLLYFDQSNCSIYGFLSIDFSKITGISGILAKKPRLLSLGKRVIAIFPIISLLSFPGIFEFLNLLWSSYHVFCRLPGVIF
jgi:hypothetical protein